MSLFAGACVAISSTGATLYANGKESSIVEHSPFLPPDYQKSSGPKVPVSRGAPSRSLEFRGVFEIEGVLHFSILDKRSQKSEWVKFQDESANYYVQRYDSTNKNILVIYGQAIEELQLSESSNSPLPVFHSNPFSSFGSTPPPPPSSSSKNGSSSSSSKYKSNPYSKNKRPDPVESFPETTEELLEQLSR